VQMCLTIIVFIKNMGNATCAGLCGTPALDQNSKGEIRNSFIQRDLQ
jgi:hypothetical protein